MRTTIFSRVLVDKLNEAYNQFPKLGTVELTETGELREVFCRLWFPGPLIFEATGIGALKALETAVTIARRSLN